MNKTYCKIKKKKSIKRIVKSRKKIQKYKVKLNIQFIIPCPSTVYLHWNDLHVLLIAWNHAWIDGGETGNVQHHWLNKDSCPVQLPRAIGETIQDSRLQ